MLFLNSVFKKGGSFLFAFTVPVLYAAPSEFFQTSGEEHLWTVKHGRNLRTVFRSNIPGPQGKNCTVFQVGYRDPSIRDPDARWFSITKPLCISRSDVEGIAFEMCSTRRNGWSLSFALEEEDGTVFRVPGRPPETAPPEFTGYRFRFKDMVCRNDRTRKLDPTKIRAFRLDGGAPVGSLYFRNFELIVKETAAVKPFVRVRMANCDNRSNTLWCGQGAELVLEFADFPKGADAVRCVINDYYGTVVRETEFPLTEKKRVWKPGVLPGGYYELRAYPSAGGKTMDRKSCIRTGGTQLPGLFTFAVSPEKRGDIAADMKKRGLDSFFGIQNPRTQYGTALSCGAPWEINMPRWSWHEPKPEPMNGGKEPVWLKKELAKGKAPDYLYSVCSFVHHASQVPGWAKVPRTERNKLGARNFNEFVRYVRNSVKLHAYRYSHQPVRPYELTWEPDLSGWEPAADRAENKVLNSALWTAADTVDFYRKLAPVIRSTDPRAQILGPKATLNLEYLEETLRLGLGSYIDAVSMHFYSTPVPEEGNLPRHIARIRELCRKYTGKVLEIYNTEGGYHSRINGVDDLKKQARNLIRYALIMQGEGLKMYLMFYIFDFGLKDYGRWGLYFNPQKQANFGPEEIMPKPSAAAYGVTTSLLRGAKPLMHLRWTDTDVWGYVFIRDGKPVIALWTPYRVQRLHFPVGNLDRVTVADFMGRRREIRAERGIIRLDISPEPCYLLGADAGLWNGIYANRTPDGGIVPLELYLGEKTMVSNPVPGAVWSANSVTVSETDGHLALAVPPDAAPGIVPLTATDKSGKKIILFARINHPLVLGSPSVFRKHNQMVMRVPVRNTAALPFRAELNVHSAAGIRTRKLELAEKHEVSAEIPVQEITAAFDPLKPFQGTLELKTAERILKRPFSFTFLAAYEGKRPGDSIFTDVVELSGKGASGKTDRTVVRFSRNRRGLRLQIECGDASFHQIHSNDAIWRQDSIQVAFDTDPGNVFEYDEATARTSKKVTSLGFALTPEGPLAWRYLTFQENRLRTGNVSADIPFTVRREGERTVYDITIPWKEIGMTEREASAGKQLGIALLVNDSDGRGTQRCCLPLFGGIYDNSGWRNFGILTLQ